MKALVTGCDGFIGRSLCPALGQAGYHVYGTENFIKDSLVTGLAYDVVVHLAANIVNVDTRARMGMGAFRDIQLDYKVCQWVEEHPPTKAFVMMSSCAVDSVTDPYGAIKRTLEAFGQALHRKGVPVVILRPFSGYGPGQSLEYPFPAILDRALKHENPLTVWGGYQIRDWLYIDDLISGIMYAIDNFPRDGKPVELGTGIGVTFLELANLIAEAVGYKPDVVADLTKATASDFRVARMGEAYGWHPKVSLRHGIWQCLQAAMVTGA